jgi:hypothetical protein
MFDFLDSIAETATTVAVAVAAIGGAVLTGAICGPIF